MSGARRIVLATHNPHKVTELRRILGDLLGDVELIGYDGPEPVEDGDTFEANALLKARAAAAHTGLPAIADDSGISVDALGGAPGIRSARYAGTRDDGDNLALLIRELRGVSPDERGARFTCAAAAVIPGPDGAQEYVETACWAGSVLEAPTGGGGFGYDPIFRPDDGGGRSAAELTPEEKDARSHRTQAFTALLPWVLGKVI